MDIKFITPEDTLYDDVNSVICRHEDRNGIERGEMVLDLAELLNGNDEEEREHNNKEGRIDNGRNKQTPGMRSTIKTRCSA